MNFDIFRVQGGGLVKHWTNGVEFEEEARWQVENAAKMPFIYPHIAVMPDVHAGKGATVGSVIPTRGAIIPAAVGVDIGCGMSAVMLPISASDLPDSLAKLRSEIERVVPHGRTNGGQQGDRGAWHNVPKHHESLWANDAYGLLPKYLKICDKHPVALKMADHQLGSLGTGNHFIEICLDESQGVWVVLHSGSRGAGNKIGTYFIDKAKEEMRRWFINLPDKDLSYLPEGSECFDDYIEAVEWAQAYASYNRRLMMFNVLTVVSQQLSKVQAPTDPLVISQEYPTAINCHHNYVTRENHGGENVLITRKGAVCARLGMMGIIPGSMGAKSYIVRGKGSQNSLHSCSHGAGRRMSRKQAKHQFTLADHELATQGVECRKDADVIDETPGAYKDIDLVMEAQKDLVEIVHTLKQVVCVKG